jgi:hypothetical protein
MPSPARACDSLGEVLDLMASDSGHDAPSTGKNHASEEAQVQSSHDHRQEPRVVKRL